VESQWADPEIGKAATQPAAGCGQYQELDSTAPLLPTKKTSRLSDVRAVAATFAPGAASPVGEMGVVWSWKEALDPE